MSNPLGTVFASFHLLVAAASIARAQDETDRAAIAGPVDILVTIAARLTDQVLLYTLAISLLIAVLTYLCRNTLRGAILMVLGVTAIAFGGPILLRTFFVEEVPPSREGDFAGVVRTAPSKFTMLPGTERIFEINCPPELRPIGVNFDTAFPARVNLNKTNSAVSIQILNLHGTHRPPRDGWVSAICAQG